MTMLNGNGTDQDGVRGRSSLIAYDYMHSENLEFLYLLLSRSRILCT